MGMLPGFLGIDRLICMSNIAIGIAGALVGALLGMGDTPLLVGAPFLNEKTLMVAVSLLFVVGRVSATRSRSNRQ